MNRWGYLTPGEILFTYQRAEVWIQAIRFPRRLITNERKLPPSSLLAEKNHFPYFSSMEGPAADVGKFPIDSHGSLKNNTWGKRVMTQLLLRNLSFT